MKRFSYFFAKIAKNLLLAMMALLLSYAVFLFMYSLVIQKEYESEDFNTFIVTNITLPDEKPPEPDKEEPQENIEDMPQTQSLALKPLVITTNTSSIVNPMLETNLSLKPFEFDKSASLKGLSSVTRSFSQGKSIVNVGEKFTPVASLQPDIPEMAWINRINGWVEISIDINENGKVTQVNILDSAPKGVFEDEVTKAIYRWLYRPYVFEGKAVAIKLKQRIELFWEDYPNNVNL
jgi:TonB family protein